MATRERNKAVERPGPDPLLALMEQSLEVAYLASNGLLCSSWLGLTSRPYTVFAQLDRPVDVALLGGEFMPVKAGGGYLIPEGMQFQTRCKNASVTVSSKNISYWANYKFRVLGELDLFHFIESPYVVNTNVAARMTSLSQRLAVNAEQSATPLIVRIGERRKLCSEMLALIISISRPRPGAMETATVLARLVPVFRFMREQMARPIFREELAKIVELSPPRFDVVFRNATGQTPLEYLIHMRLKRAQELLLSSQQPVNEIGQAVGFRDAGHFSEMFKRHHGMGPRSYRKRLIALPMADS